MVISNSKKIDRALGIRMDIKVGAEEVTLQLLEDVGRVVLMGRTMSAGTLRWEHTIKVRVAGA